MPTSIAVIGAGTMGSGIALLFASAGHMVTLCDRSRQVAATALEKLEQRINSGVARSLYPASATTWLERIELADDAPSAAVGRDVVIEAVSEDEELKGRVLASVAGAVSASTLIASNTSSLPIDRLAAHVAGPERFLGIHFFNPAELIPGVEVVTHDSVDEGRVDWTMGLLVDVGKRPARVASSPGFVANRLQMALFLEALRCVEEGLATAEAVDTIVSSTFGFRLPAYGPFGIADMAGLDVYGSILGVLEDGLGAQFATPDLLRSLIAEGRLGVKTRAGFHDYGADGVLGLLEERDRTYQHLLAAVGRASPAAD